MTATLIPPSLSSSEVPTSIDFRPPEAGEYSSGSITYAFIEESSEIPADFLEALDDFAHGRVVSDQIALYQPPPNA